MYISDMPHPLPTSIVPGIRADRISDWTTMKIMRKNVALTKVRISLTFCMKPNS